MPSFPLGEFLINPEELRILIHTLIRSGKNGRAEPTGKGSWIVLQPQIQELESWTGLCPELVSIVNDRIKFSLNLSGCVLSSALATISHNVTTHS